MSPQHQRVLHLKHWVQFLMVAKSKVQELIQPGDIFLVKGSQGMRMEKVVEEIMANPENKKELLVRQSKKWQNT